MKMLATTLQISAISEKDLTLQVILAEEVEVPVRKISRAHFCISLFIATISL